MKIFEKLIDFYKRIQSLFSKAFKKEITLEEKIELIAFIIGLICLIGITVFISYHFFTIVFTILAGYLLWDEFKPKKPNQPPSPPKDYIVSTALIIVDYDTYKSLGLSKPHSIADMTPEISIKPREGIDVIEVEIMKNNFRPLEEIPKEIIKKKLQHRLIALLKQGKIPYVPFGSLDNKTPIIYITGIQEHEYSIIIEVIYVVSDKELNYIHSKARQMRYDERNKEQVSEDDKDF